ncbi:putative HNHc nuclease [Mitsuokella jalaludinii]|uniref:putative HNHc nuclease n=1 Tax=Mitsuokella jalaludinii TaxID=187979 RepID=UPI0020D0BAD8|nr:putative HNHc nuclease [Mitsuokella jalaludinii]MCQ1533543.1 putative HNHc nuclease [Mitsuokella jalaludinii]
MVQEHVIGEIQDVREDGRVIIMAGLPDLDRALLRQYSKVEVILPDGRKISCTQRRKVYALLGEIAEYVDGIRNADTIEEQKRLLKMEFMLKRMESAERRMFSLSDCDMSTAREFITYLIDFIIANDIPTRVPLIDNCDDIAAYMYACTMHRKCAVCGKAADIHHCEGSRIGAGVDRDKVHQLGREILPLCRVHHTELHAMPESEFMKKYHLQKVRLDEALCKRLKLRR